MIKVVHYSKIESEDVDEKEAEGVKIRWLISKPDGAENFAMRLFDIKPNGHSAFHSHDWEHEVFVLEGKGIVKLEDSEKKIGKGSVVFIPSKTKHSLINKGEKKLRFLCMIPNKK